MVEQVAQKPLGVAVKVLCGGSLTLCIESVQFELDPIKKLDKVKKKGRYLDLSAGPAARVTEANVKGYGFESVRKMVDFLHDQLPRTAEGRKSGAAFMYSLILGKQTVPLEGMQLPALLDEIERRTMCKPSGALTRETAVVALRGLREICGENVTVAQVTPPPMARSVAQAKERTLVEDLFSKFNGTASVGTDAR